MRYFAKITLILPQITIEKNLVIITLNYKERREWMNNDKLDG